MASNDLWFLDWSNPWWDAASGIAYHFSVVYTFPSEVLRQCRTVRDEHVPQK